MSDFLTQTVLAQRSPGEEPWMSILVFIVVAVFWVIGAVVKAMKAKSSDEQQPSRTPVRKPPVHSRGGQQQMPGRTQRPTGPAQRPWQPSPVSEKRTTLGDLREAARKFAAEAEQAFQAQTPKPMPKPPEPASKPQIQPDMKPHVEPVVAPITGLADEQAAPTPPRQHLSELLSDYTDPDKLRRAILHYEILGPPLSLRD